ncbi:hypothetical protein PJE062_838 [Pseudovibrio sp. JE062]|nr:hypothetical protein PJE062_838 [Pseudovibrio sp. JE062]
MRFREYATPPKAHAFRLRRDQSAEEPQLRHGDDLGAAP